MLLSENIAVWPLRSLVYALPYLGMGIMVYFVGYKEIEKSKRICQTQAGFLFVTFLLFFGLRWHLLSDTLAYEDEFYTFKANFNWAYIDAHSWWWDKGFIVFAMLCKMVNPDFFFFVFVNTLVDSILFTLCLRKYKVNIPLTILSFLAFHGIAMEINAMRNIKAILLFVYSISYIQDRKLLNFLLVNLLGFTFHASALLFFPMYWILNRKYPMTLLLPFLGIVTVIYLAKINLLQDYLMSHAFSEDTSAMIKFASYLEQSEEQTLSVGTIERLATLVLCLMAYRKQANSSSFNLIILNSFFVFYVLFALFGFNEVFRERIPYLFIYAYWFFYPYAFNLWGKKRQIYKFAFLVLLFGKIYLSTNICSAYYETVLFHKTTRLQRQQLNDMLQ